MSALLRLVVWSVSAGCIRAYYANVTLSSLGGDLEVTVYLPNGVHKGEDAYYESTRFDHGSMIGSIRKVSSVLSSLGEETTQVHELYGTELWRVPHNPQWPESGVGMAAEFGVGDNGANCDYRCGWYGIDNVSNGVLGYKEALPGQSFLKIGVGELVKSSCPECDSAMDYKFNSPYEFATPPSWTLASVSSQQIVLEHEARLGRYGYHLVRTITLQDNELSITSSLKNLGKDSFSTTWYAHNFFTCDAVPIGPGYQVDLNLNEGKGPMYDEPGVLFGWSVPLRYFARVRSLSESNTVSVALDRPMDLGARVKAEFHKDEQSTGAFTLRGCGSAVHVDFPELVEPQTQQPNLPSGVSMYAFNLYMEKSALCPEPQLLIHLEPGATTSWTQRVVITDDVDSMATEGLVRRGDERARSFGLAPTLSDLSHSSVVEMVRQTRGIVPLALVVCGVAYVAVGWIVARRSGPRAAYTPIPDDEDP